MAAKSLARPGNSSWPARQEWPRRSPRVIFLAMKSKARLAISSQAGSSNTRPALTRAPIISPFQSASTLSSRPGRTRLARGARPGARPAAPRRARPARARAEQRAAAAIGERSDAVLRTKERQRQQLQELRVVVQHLLEMRD